MVEEKLFGVLKDGQEVRNYILKNENGTVVVTAKNGVDVEEIKSKINDLGFEVIG